MILQNSSEIKNFNGFKRMSDVQLVFPEKYISWIRKPITFKVETDHFILDKSIKKVLRQGIWLASKSGGPNLEYFYFLSYR